MLGEEMLEDIAYERFCELLIAALREGGGGGL